MNRFFRVRIVAHPRIVAACMIVAVPLSVATARQLSPTPSTPATGHAQVITQGIATLPDEQLVWRVVERTAQPRWQAKSGERVLGFVLASEDPVLLTNVDVDGTAKDVARLGSGEAFLVEAGTKQIRASMTDQPVTYLSLEIVPAADANKVGNGTVLYVSEPFTPLTGQRDIDLVRNVLRLRETATVPDTGNSVYILATDGAIDILPATAEIATTLQTGESGIFTGPLEIKAVQASADGAGQIAASAITADLLQDADTSAGYVVAVIGEEIGPVQTPTPAPTETPVPTATEPPTEFPTEQPTAFPTEEPTKEPPAEPTATTPSDSDEDGLSDEMERQYGTSPRNPDTDDDGLKDGEEVYSYGTNPADGDSDDDYLSDGAEINTYGTDPNNPDTDGDKIIDGREVSGGTDPLDPRDPPRISG